MSEFREGDIVAIECKVASVGVGSDGLRLLPKSGASLFVSASDATLVRAAFAFGDEVRVELGDRKGIVLAVTEDHFFAWVRFTRDDDTPDLRTVETRILKRWDHREAPAEVAVPNELGEGWASWTGGDDRPVDGLVEVRFADAKRNTEVGSASAWRWKWWGNEGDIVAYRLVPVEDGPTWIEWDGGGPCPVDGETKVRVRTRNGGTTTALAKVLRWSHADPATTTGAAIAPLDIVAYYVVTGGC